MRARPQPTKDRVPRLQRAVTVLAACLFATSTTALEVVRAPEPQHVFADGARAVEVRFRNAAAEPIHLEARLQLLQLTSSTAAPVGGVRAWKSLTVLPGQTVLESATIQFPQVRASARFAARWLDATGKLLGVTEVWAHPESLLDTLTLLAGGQPIGLSDWNGVLRPALAARGIAVSELHSAQDWNDFRGRLAFVVSKPETDQGKLRLEPAALARVKEGLAVVWFQTSPAIAPPGPAWVERVSAGRGTVLLVSASTIDGLDRSPAAQNALVRLAELALTPPTQVLASEP